VFKRRQYFSLDIGTNNVKAVQLRRGRRGVELDKFASVPIFPSGRPDADSDIRMAKIDAIQRAVATAKISSKHVISSISGDAIIVRYIQLPAMTAQELQSALRYEAEEYIPFPIEEVNLASHILGEIEDANGRRINVLLVAAKKDVVAEHVDLIRGAGLQPHCVDVDSFALFNCYSTAVQPMPEEVVVLVDVGADVTNINIYHDGTSHFARDINLGGDNITTAIQQKLGIDFMEAENLKYAEGVHIIKPTPVIVKNDEEEDSALIDSIQDAVSDIADDCLGSDDFESQAARVIRNSLNGLLTEIRRSLQFFENQVSGRPVTRMVLSGGTAKLPNMPQFFSQELGIPVDVLDPLQGITVNSKNVDEHALTNCRELLGVGVGLALREVA
jgi:type IV pilus assembly protein PilM